MHRRNVPATDQEVVVGAGLPREAGDAVQQYDEFACEKGSYGLLRGMEFMQTLIKPLPSKGE